MDLELTQLFDALNDPLPIRRTQALVELKTRLDAGLIEKPALSHSVNNHIHSFYSFSPYSPTKAVWMAYQAGLATAGIMDHDSVSGAREFVLAGKILGLPTTVGCEMRTTFAGTSIEGRKTNNPDQKTVTYITLHGIPHNQFEALDQFLKPIRIARGIRNRNMVTNLNRILLNNELRLDYDRDVLPLSHIAEGGSVTERHILFALSLKLISKYPFPQDLIEFLTTNFQLNVSDKIAQLLLSPDNPYLAFDLLGLLKSELVERFYIMATDECPPIAEVVRFAKDHGIIMAYPYLGDVADSITGDKRAQSFEDDYLPELFELIKKLEFNAVTYMPTRNTRQQLERMRNLCEAYGMFQISGEDINQPRQAFVCEAMHDPSFSNLYDAAWALIGHEQRATTQLDLGMFSAETLILQPDLNQRITAFRDAAISLYRL